MVAVGGVTVLTACLAPTNSAEVRGQAAAALAQLAKDKAIAVQFMVANAIPLLAALLSIRKDDAAEVLVEVAEALWTLCAVGATAVMELVASGAVPRVVALRRDGAHPAERVTKATTEVLLCCAAYAVEITASAGTDPRFLLAMLALLSDSSPPEVRMAAADVLRVNAASCLVDSSVIELLGGLCYAGSSYDEMADVLVADQQDLLDVSSVAEVTKAAAAMLDALAPGTLQQERGAGDA